MTKFNDISLKTKTVSEKQQKGYKVFSDNTNFQVVEAATAAEAIEKSGIKAPYKVEPAGIVTKSIFSQAELLEAQVAAPTSPVIEPQAPANPA